MQLQKSLEKHFAEGAELEKRIREGLGRLVIPPMTTEEKTMMHSYEAEIDVKGRIRLLEPVQLHGPCRAVVTVMASVPDEGTDRALLHFAESSLFRDWEWPEEEEAWAHLQPDKFSGNNPLAKDD
ncbi:MAG: hypothetical protein H7833_02870 [Magnetococcus sp. DMHC-1]